MKTRWDFLDLDLDDFAAHMQTQFNPSQYEETGQPMLQPLEG